MVESRLVSFSTVWMVLISSDILKSRVDIDFPNWLVIDESTLVLSFTTSYTSSLLESLLSFSSIYEFRGFCSNIYCIFYLELTIYSSSLELVFCYFWVLMRVYLEPSLFLVTDLIELSLSCSSSSSLTWCKFRVFTACLINCWRLWFGASFFFAGFISIGLPTCLLSLSLVKTSFDSFTL